MLRAWHRRALPLPGAANGVEGQLHRNRRFHPDLPYPVHCAHAPVAGVGQVPRTEVKVRSSVALTFYKKVWLAVRKTSSVV